jgi:hypothetical protein
MTDTRWQSHAPEQPETTAQRRSRAEERLFQRRYRKIGHRIDALMERDAAWFDCRPDRTIRIRRATAVELEEQRIAGRPPTPAGFYPHVVVKQLAPGIRMRVPFATTCPVPKLSEKECFEILNLVLGRNAEV